MNEKPESFEETLAKFILPEKCTGCAACVITCPFNLLRVVNEKPELISECKACGICSEVCPQYLNSQSTLERFVFGRERKHDENFGVYRRVVVARSTDKNVLKVCQDGGVVTTLLTLALKNGEIDGAVVSGVKGNRPLYPKPIIATTPEQILQSSGTRYFYSPNLLALQKSREQDLKKLAFVGPPCQITAVRKIQMLHLEKYAEDLKLTIGLLCSGSFYYEEFIEKYLKTKLNLNPFSIKKINIKEKVLITMKSGETREIPLKNVQQLIRTPCHTCTDFSAELSDLSVGGLGLNGWSLVIIRTENGERFFENAVKAGMLRLDSIKRHKRSLNLLIKLSKKRKKNSF